MNAPYRRTLIGQASGCRRAFTSAELLVVIALMMILTALLFPVFGRIRSRSRQAACVSNLAQIARAGLLYLQDNDERFPSCYSSLEPPYYIDPRTSLQPYLESWELFYCPERHTVVQACLDPAAEFRPHSRCMGYGYNWGSGLTWGDSYYKGDGLVRRSDRRPNVVVGVTLAEVAVPAHCFFYGDTNDYAYITLLRGAMPGVRRAGDPNATTNELGMPYEPPRHSGGNNFAFVDGHVQWQRFPGGRWEDGGPWVVPDMSMYSRTGRWEPVPLP